MKTSAFLFALLFTAAVSYGQSKSFYTLKHKFSGEEDVFSFNASGFLARTVLWMAGEHDFREAISEVKSIRFITIPKKAFRDRNVSVGGLKKLIQKESFSEMISVKDHGDEVTIFMQDDNGGRNNHYFMLIDNSSEVVAIEIKGYIDPEELSRSQRRLSYNEASHEN